METLIENVYVRCILLSIVGWLLNMLKNLNNVRRETIEHTIEFSYSKYFNMEKITLLGNILYQTMVVIYIPDIIKATGKDWMATIFIGVCAFFGSEFITSVFGTARSTVRHIVSSKTTISDENTGTTVDNPTPLKPTEKNI